MNIIEQLNAEQAAKIELGQMLFYDGRLSTNNKISCSSCHDLTKGGTDNKAKSEDRAFTDAEGSVRFDREEKPGVSNLLTIYSALTGRSIEQLESEYAGRGYGDFKKGLAEVVVEEFGPVRERVLALLDDPAELDRILAANAARADEVADATLSDVYDKVGLLRRV